MTRLLRERDIAADLVKRVSELGGIYRKVAWEGRSDAPRNRGTHPRKTVPQFIDDFEASFSGDF